MPAELFFHGGSGSRSLYADLGITSRAAALDAWLAEQRDRERAVGRFPNLPGSCSGVRAQPADAHHAAPQSNDHRATGRALESINLIAANLAHRHQSDLCHVGTP